MNELFSGFHLETGINDSIKPKELLSLLPDEISLLKEQVQSSHGKIRVLVHPFDQENNRLTKEYYIALNRLLASTDPNTLPTIMLLEAEGLDDSYRDIDKLVSHTLAKRLYFVPTYAYDPTPNPDKRGENLHSDRDRNKNLCQLIDILKDVGVTATLIGGQNLLMTTRMVCCGDDNRIANIQLTNKGWNGKQNIEFEMCVGILIKRFANNFMIDISNISYPSRPGNFLRTSKSATSFYSL